MFRIFVVCLAVTNFIVLVQTKCTPEQQGYIAPYLYDDLKCIPKFDSSINENCPVRYDCSHIYSRPEKTCFYKGKVYKVGELLDAEDVRDVFLKFCTCTENLNFECPRFMDGCAEFWVGGYPQPGCYLRHELNSECSVGEICPPFDGNAKCKVKDVTYKEGDLFTHPDDECTKCVCDKGFDGKLAPPFCQPVNCTLVEFHNTKNIDNYCAPFYDESDSCCPKSFICPADDGIYGTVPGGIPQNRPISEYYCKFGERIMGIGEYYKHEDISCDCFVPPFLTCGKVAKASLK